jgi:nucleotide-binding universal stress UspA family protein
MMKTILVPVDFSDVTSRVIDEAVRLAKAFSARLILLHVAQPEPEFIGYDPGPPSVRNSVARELVEEHKRIHALDHLLEQEGLKVTSLVVQGYPLEKIIAEADKFKVDLIVMGSHGHGMLYHLLVGSVAEGVLRQARCPVLVVPSRG